MKLRKKFGTLSRSIPLRLRSVTFDLSFLFLSERPESTARNLCMQQISFFDDKKEAGKKNDFLPASVELLRQWPSLARALVSAKGTSGITEP